MILINGILRAVRGFLDVIAIRIEEEHIVLCHRTILISIDLSLVETGVVPIDDK